jgi:hypothetical protein
LADGGYEARLPQLSPASAGAGVEAPGGANGVGPGAGGGGAASTSPAGAAASAATSGPAAADVEPVNGLMPIKQALTVQEALAYSPQEKTILDDYRFDPNHVDDQLNTPALYVLLRRVMMLPPAHDVLESADRVSPSNLWKDPQRYRGQLIRVEGLFADSEARPIMDWSGNAIPTKWWGAREIFVGDVEVFRAKDDPQPILVFMAERPADRFPLGQKVEVVGLFYKVVELPENDQTGDRSKKHLYPVFVARTIYPAGGMGAGPVDAPSLLWSLIGLGVVMMAVIFFMLRKRVAIFKRADTQRRPFGPLSFEQLRAKYPDEEEDGPVDEDLIQQAKAYRQQHGLDKDKDERDKNSR